MWLLFILLCVVIVMWCRHVTVCGGGVVCVVVIHMTVCSGRGVV